MKFKSTPLRVGVGQAEKYYPVLFRIVDTVQDKCETYYVEDLRAWASGDISSMAGMEGHVIMLLAQALLAYVERREE